MRVLVVEGPLLPSQAAHWDHAQRLGVDLHMFGTLRPPMQDWWTTGVSPEIDTELFTPREWSQRGTLWWTYPGLGAAVKRLNPDVIHVTQEPWALFFSQLDLHRYRVAAQGGDNLWVHGAWLENRIRLWRARRILSRLSGFASWNSDGIRLAKKYGLSADLPTLIAPSRVPELGPFDVARSERARHRDRFEFGSEVIVGYVGRLASEKGVEWLFESMAAADIPNASVALFGNGDEEKALKHRAAELGVSALFKGSVSPDDIPAVMAAIDILVVPSLTRPEWAEQFGRVVVEGMLAGTPVISSDSGSLPEVVGDGGTVVPEKDVQALAQVLLTLGSSAESRSQEGQKARNWAESRFGPEALARQYVRFWTDIHSR